MSIRVYRTDGLVRHEWLPLDGWSLGDSHFLDACPRPGTAPSPFAAPIALIFLCFHSGASRLSWSLEYASMHLISSPDSQLNRPGWKVLSTSDDPPFPSIPTPSPVHSSYYCVHHPITVIWNFQRVRSLPQNGAPRPGASDYCLLRVAGSIDNRTAASNNAKAARPQTSANETFQ